MPRLHPSILLAALVVVACQDAGADPGSAPPVVTDQVSVVDHRFEAPNVAVRPGDTVTWTWEGSAAHDVVGDDFASEVQRAGTFTHTFDAPGVYEYVCTLHNRMRGQVVVQAP